MSHKPEFKTGETKFLNVDLEIRSRSDLQPLVNAFRNKVDLLYVGRLKRTYSARIELAKYPIKGPDSAIRDFCKLINQLSPEDRDMWDNAKLRELDIGIAAGPTAHTYWFAIEPETIAMIAEINAKISVTIYPPGMKTASRDSGPRSTRRLGNDQSKNGH